MEDPTIIT